MATVGITVGNAMGAGAPVYATIPDQSIALTSGGTSVQSAALNRSGYIRIVTTGTIWVSVGVNPTAASGTGYLVTDSIDLGPCKIGDKVAVIDA